MISLQLQQNMVLITSPSALSPSPVRPLPWRSAGQRALSSIQRNMVSYIVSHISKKCRARVLLDGVLNDVTVSTDIKHIDGIEWNVRSPSDILLSRETAEFERRDTNVLK